MISFAKNTKLLFALVLHNFYSPVGEIFNILFFYFLCRYYFLQYGRSQAQINMHNHKINFRKNNIIILYNMIDQKCTQV